ncbi:MAG: hypothetical protein V8T01_10490 [Oscillospiraceae bacterium]
MDIPPHAAARQHPRQDLPDLLFQLFYGLFGGCSYLYLNPSGYATYDNSSSYSDTYQSGNQQTDPYYGYGFGSQKSTNTQEG